MAVTVAPAPATFHQYLRNFYLITKSDHATILYPQTYFALVSAFAGSVLSTSSTLSIASIFFNVPKVLLFCSINVLIIGLTNQRLPSSVMEDKVNKPWRNIPADRITSEQYRFLALVVIPLALAISGYLGVMMETGSLIILNYMYNDMEGADEHFVFRNAFNVGAHFSFQLGALRIVCGSQGAAINSTAYAWLAIIAAIVFTTISVQDLKDQKGDKLRGRKSAPLVLGNTLTRWSIAVLVLLWSVICPLFFQAEWWAYTAIAAVGVWVGVTVIRPEHVANDKLAFYRWTVWMMTLYLLPLTKNIDFYLIEGGGILWPASLVIDRP